MVNNAKSRTPPKFPNISLNVYKIYSHFVSSPTKYNRHIPESLKKPTWLNTVMSLAHRKIPLFYAKAGASLPLA